MYKHLVFIDSRVADFQTLVAGLSADTEWVLLDADQDGVRQMQAVLADRCHLASIKILAHGRPGALMIGAGELTCDSLDDHAEELATIGQALGGEGDVQIYGCEVGQGSEGRAFVRALAEAVGAHVGASSGIVGHAEMGGEWRLDVGQSSTAQLNLSEWQGLLGLTITPLTLSYPGHSSGEYRNDFAFAALRADGSVVTWGAYNSGGDSSAVATKLDGSIDVTQVFSGLRAFAALRADGSVVTWGSWGYGGDSSAVATQLDGRIDVTQVFSTSAAFAALRADGSVVTWGEDYGNGNYGGDSSDVATQLNGDIRVTQVFSTYRAFAALRADGSVVTWGNYLGGGDSSDVETQLDGTIDVTQVFSNQDAFAALRSDGSVVTWGLPIGGGDSSAVAMLLDGSIQVTHVFSNYDAFAALRADGSVVTWGLYGGDSRDVTTQLDGSIDVTQVFSTGNAFAALRADGSVVTWGYSPSGGDSSTVATQLDGSIKVTQVFSTDTAFAALRADGSVVTWGSRVDSMHVATQLDGSIDVTQIFSNSYGFAALRVDGSVVTWGYASTGSNGDTIGMKFDGSIDVTQIFSNSHGFVAIRIDGSVVTWRPTLDGRGDNDYDYSSAVASQLTSVVSMANPYTNDVFTSTMTGRIITGTPGDDPLLLGGTGGDEIHGLGGNDTLDGAGGNDTMFGGLGNDIYYVRQTGDIVTENLNEGTDIAYSTLAAYTLTANVENGRILATGAANLNGNSLNNTLYAGVGNNVLSGGGGSDTVSFAYGVMFGSAGVSANLALGTARTTDSLSFDTLIGIANLTGSAYDDQLTGNGAVNVLNGGAGADQMSGGNGSDWYYVDNSGDIVSETNATASSGGTDTAYSTLAAYTLTPNVENGRILATGAANLTGNSLNNTLYAGVGNNVLSGGGGSDTVSFAYGVSGVTGVTISLAVGTAQATGGSGSDTLIGIANLTGSAYADTLTGNGAANVLSGSGGSDTIAGWEGNDQIDGGDGIDTADFFGNFSDYQIDFLADGRVSVSDLRTSFNPGLQGGEGIDLLKNIENLSFADGEWSILGSSLNKISASNITAVAPYNNDYIDSLLWGFKWNSNTITWSYNTSGSAGEFNASTKAAIEDAIKTIENITNLTFSKLADNATSTLKFFAGTEIVEFHNYDRAGFAIPPQRSFMEKILYLSDGNICYNTTYFNENDNLLDGESFYNQGGTGFHTILHEICHSLGLAHPHDSAGLSGVFPGVTDEHDIGDFENNRSINTVMSYVHEIPGNPTKPTSAIRGLLDYGFVASPMGFDIAALQYLYGANASSHSGSDTYALPSSNSSIDDYFRCIWDTGGIDQIVNYGNGNCTIDLRPTMLSGPDAGGFLSSVSGIYGGVTIAPDYQNGSIIHKSIIENATGGGGDDHLVGNSYNNILYGLSGSDVLIGGGGNDILDGGIGDDVINGGEGTDTASYSHANFSMTVDLTIGTSQFTGDSSAGSDTLFSIENLTGSDFSDTLTGNSAANILDGGFGNDNLAGGSGDDVYIINTLSDVVIEKSAEGTDLIQSAISYSLIDTDGAGANGGNVENLQLTGAASINGTGNILNNVIYANSGINSIDGGVGSDTVSYFYASTTGSTGVTLNLSVINASGQATASGISGADLVKNVENITGSNYKDTLTGNAGANVLNGGSGIDTLTGNDGSDTYYVDNTGDTVTEINALSTGGTDLVCSFLSTYTLTPNVENGRISTTAASNLTGNTLNNDLYAGAGNNTLNGGTGIDTASYLYATAAVTVSLERAGAQVTVGSGSDTLTSIEKLTGSRFSDTLTGNSTANTLNGGLGNDILTSGAGADFIRFDTLLNATSNRDTITDFSVINDTLQLENAIFGSLTTIGTLAAGSFHSGAGFTSAADANDYVIYNTTTGALYYDAGGNTGAAAVQFATLTGAPALTNLDFMVT
jgi:Ca2+-binding RTX toxin-like protein